MQNIFLLSMKEENLIKREILEKTAKELLLHIQIDLELFKKNFQKFTIY